MQMKSTASRMLLSAIVLAAAVAPAFSQTATSSSSDEVNVLKEQIAVQQKQIDQLLAAMNEMKRRMDQVDRSPQSAPQQTPNLGQVASLAPVIPAAPATAGVGAAPLMPPADPGKAPVTQEQQKAYTEEVSKLEKGMEALNKGVAGFRFGGDLRLRTDGIWRTGNAVGPPQQNVRERYRLRFNIDKSLSNQFDFHVQVSSGVLTNPLTFDTDFTATAVRGEVFISEYWAEWHPNKVFDVRVGRQPEVYADNTRFLWDDDVRFNGFQEIVKSPAKLGGATFQVKAAQYILTNPNVPVVPSAAACTVTPQVITTLPATITVPSVPPAACAYLSAGYQPGQHLRSTDMFDQGFQINGGEKWANQFWADAVFFTNVNQIQLASTTAGAAVVVSPAEGVVLTGPIAQTGNATTTKGGAIYTAPRYQVGRLGYRLTYNGMNNFPIWLDLQGARNFGVGFLRNAFMVTLNGGNVQKFGDVRFLYAFAYKDANSVISQFTDDDLGTTTGVNIRTHVIRFDLGLTKFLQWQNIFFIQNPISGNDPSRNFYVPVPKGVNTSYRLQSQFQFTF